jgi:F-type H+-transporting ATPase subunit gamma
MAMVEVLEALANKGGSAHPLLQPRSEVKNVCVIAVVSDRGLAGGFNSSVLRAADKYIHKLKAEGKDATIISCGKRASSYFNYRKMPMAMEFHDQSADPLISSAREIGSFIAEAYEKGEIDEVVLFYNHAKNVADQVLTFETVLPVGAPEFHDFDEDDGSDLLLDESAKAAAAGAREKMAAARAEGADVSMAADNSGNFEFEPTVDEVLNVLIPSYVETRIYHALLDSAAGEQGARRKAMKAATDNATDMVTSLTRVFNRVRQGAITTEITEIVGGAAALEEE